MFKDIIVHIFFYILLYKCLDKCCVLDLFFLVLQSISEPCEWFQNVLQVMLMYKRLNSITQGVTEGPGKFYNEFGYISPLPPP